MVFRRFMLDMVTRTRREVLRIAGIGIAISLTGCRGLSIDSPSTDTPPPTETPEAASNPDYVRPCDERIWGSFDPDHDDHINVGPLTFALVRTYMPTFDNFAPEGTSVKARIAIEPGIVVTLVVPEAQREHVALDYNWNNWYTNGDPLDTAQRSVRFEACGSDSLRQYNGGIVVTDPRCATVEVWVEGENVPRQAALPVGTECKQ